MRTKYTEKGMAIIWKAELEQKERLVSTPRVFGGLEMETDQLQLQPRDEKGSPRTEARKTAQAPALVDPGGVDDEGGEAIWRTRHMMFTRARKLQRQQAEGKEPSEGT